MKDKDFCNIDTAFYGEKVDHIDQIAMRSFNGKELKEYVEFAIQQVNGAELESGKALHKQSVSKAEGEQLCKCDDRAAKHFVKNWCDDCKKHIV